MLALRDTGSYNVNTCGDSSTSCAFPSITPMPTTHPAAAADTQFHDIKSILILDDDADITNTLKQLLESENFLVTTASNGVEGLKEVMEMDFDVIICDMMMPTMPGDMFYLAVQKVKPEMCARFLFVTGHGNDERVNSFLRKTDGLGLCKPVPADELLQMIYLVIKRNAAR